MEIQNITGSETIVNKFSENIKIKNENSEPENNQVARIKSEPDENETRGRTIDKTI